MNHCLLCSQPIRKTLGHESRPDNLACWTHVAGGYQCPGARSEFDLATFNPEEVREEATTEATVPEDFCI